MPEAPRPRLAPARSPGGKLVILILLGLFLAIPLFSVYLLVYDRESQSQTARGSIVQGWGAPQQLAGPFLVLPFSRLVETTTNENGRDVTRTERREEALFIAPTTLAIETKLAPEKRRRSIYEAVIYTANVRAAGAFRLPDFAALNIDPATIRLAEAEIRVGISDAKGLAGSQAPRVTVAGAAIPLIPGSGLNATSNSGFSGRLPGPPGAVVPFEVAFAVRGHDAITLQPSAADTNWRAQSSWQHPSFTGAFLPSTRTVSAKGFDAGWRIGNLALNRPIVSIGEQNAVEGEGITINLIDPVDLYDEVSRAAKYGFLFIGFTFAALLLFDLISGVSVPGPAYLLVGAALILFFVLLLALAEVIGFTPAYLLASAAIVGLISAYSAAILKSWRRAYVIGALLIALYAVLYVLLSLEAYSLLIGSLLLFAALAAMMYFTRNIEWRAVSATPEEPAQPAV